MSQTFRRGNRVVNIIHDADWREDDHKRDADGKFSHTWGNKLGHGTGHPLTIEHPEHGKHDFVVKHGIDDGPMPDGTGQKDMFYIANPDGAIVAHGLSRMAVVARAKRLIDRGKAGWAKQGVRVPPPPPVGQNGAGNPHPPGSASYHARPDPNKYKTMAHKRWMNNRVAELDTALKSSDPIGAVSGVMESRHYPAFTAYKNTVLKDLQAQRDKVKEQPPAPEKKITPPPPGTSKTAIKSKVPPPPDVDAMVSDADDLNALPSHYKSPYAQGIAPDNARFRRHQTKKTMRRALQALPPEHLRLLSHYKMQAQHEIPGSSFPHWAEMAVPPTSVAGYHSSAGKIVVADVCMHPAPDGKGYITHEQNSASVLHTTLHEVGHGVADQLKSHGAQLEHYVASKVTEALPNMTKKERAYSAYFLQNKSEMFAELYAASMTDRYVKTNGNSGERGFAGLTLERSRALFGHLYDDLDARINAAIKERAQ